jgi:hypothetical protein
VAKATKAVIAQRVEEVLQIRLAGAAFPEIVQYASEKGWDVGPRQLQNYIRKTDRLLALAREKDRAKLLALHEAQRRLLLNKALEVGDLRTALAVLRDSAQLQDLYPAARVKVETKGLDEAIDRELANLAARGQAAAPGEAAAEDGRPGAAASVEAPAE